MRKMKEDTPAVVISNSSQNRAPDLNSCRRKLEDLKQLHLQIATSPELHPLQTHKLFHNCCLLLQTKVNQISEAADITALSSDDLDGALECLTKDLRSVEYENACLAKETEDLWRNCVEDSIKLEGELEGIDHALTFAELQGNANAADEFSNGVDIKESKFKILDLNHQIEKSETTLKSLQDLNFDLERFELIEKIEEALSGLRVVDFDGNCIRLSLKTYIPNLENLLCLQNIVDVTDTLEQNHELLIEVLEGSLELKNVEIFPHDVYIGEIIDAAKSFRQNKSSLLTRSHLEWLVQELQNRIVLCTIRRLLVKSVNNSRHSFEYLDKEEMIVAHMVGGIDAFIKLSHGWPICNSALSLTSLKSSYHSSKEISLSFLCKVKETANALAPEIRQNISSFVDSIEDILVQQMSTTLQPDVRSED